jgi:hypothetical protein
MHPDRVRPLEINDTVLTPVKSLIINERNIDILSTYAGAVSEDKTSNEFLEDMAFAIGYFLVTFRIDQMKSLVSKKEIKNILDATISFTNLIAEILVNRKLSELM